MQNFFSQAGKEERNVAHDIQTEEMVPAWEVMVLVQCDSLSQTLCAH